MGRDDGYRDKISGKTPGVPRPVHQRTITGADRGGKPVVSWVVGGSGTIINGRADIRPIFIILFILKMPPENAVMPISGGPIRLGP